MEGFIQKFGAIILAIIIQTIAFIVYLVRSNTRHEGNFAMLQGKLDEHIRLDEKAMKELKETVNEETKLTNIKLDKINEKLDKMNDNNNEFRFEVGKLIGYLERLKEKEC